MKLLIRSANHKQRDFEMPLDDTIKTVRDVKQYLSQNYPENPDVSFMRMIFQGHLLADEKLVTDLFNTEQDCYVVHLVCLPRIKTDSVPTSQNYTAPDTVRPAPTVQPTIPAASSVVSGTTTANTAAVNQPIVTSIPQMTVPIASNNWQPLPGSQRSDTAFAEWYTRYYSSWLVYLSLLQAQTIGMPNTEILRLQTQFSANVNQALGQTDGGVPPENAPAAEAAPAPHAADNRGINAAAGPLFDEDDEEGRARDLLDWVYVAVRAGILFSLIYLYSSIPRIVALIAMLGSVWLLKAALGGLHQNNNNNGAQQQQQADRQPQQENVHPAQQPQNPENGETPAAAATEANPTPPVNEQANNPPAQPPAPVPVPTYRLVFGAIAGFFLSLFPDAPGLQHLD